jgi:hypothetical protein
MIAVVRDDDDPAPRWDPPMWETGRLVAVDGNASYVVDHVDGAELPGGACALLDDTITV